MNTMVDAALRILDPVLHDFATVIGVEGPFTVRGAGTRWDHGGAVDGAARVVAAPAGIVDHRAAEMTVQVRAGTLVADLEAVLGERGQRSALPMRGGTVGGAVAVGENHLEVLGRGRLRDSVLQVRYVSAEGRLVTAGGPVVKNVSGFNLPKLMTGSLGTFGAIAELVLRTNPIPATSVWLRSEDVDPFAIPDVVLRPSAILHDRARTWVLLEGHPADVAAERSRLDGLAHFTEADGPPELPPHRWSMSPARLRSLDADATGAAVLSIGVGSAWASNPAPVRSADPVVELISNRLKDSFDPTGRCNPGRRP